MIQVKVEETGRSMGASTFEPGRGYDGQPTEPAAVRLLPGPIPALAPCGPVLPLSQSKNPY